MNEKFGHFTGECDLRFPAPPPRRKWWEICGARRPEAIVISRFEYTDPEGRTWRAEPGDATNGQSSPWWLWWLIPPFSGRGIRAGVLHDVAKKHHRNRGSKLAHNMYRNAARCDHAHPVRAWFGWKAVRLFGPRYKSRKGMTCQRQ